MRTALDDAQMWLLHAAVYQDDLRLFLVELLPGEEQEIRFRERSLGLSRPLEAREESRRMLVVFPRPVAWQVVDESFTYADSYEQKDEGGVLRVLSRSRYLDYVRTHHDGFEQTVGPARHYRVWTGDEVIDVIACDEPVIEPWEDL